MDIAMAIETANGRPSGMATMRSTMAVMTTLPISRRVALENISLSVHITRPIKNIP